jgi:hypothetical protein
MQELTYHVHVVQEDKRTVRAFAVGIANDGQGYWVWDDELGPFDTLDDMVRGLQHKLTLDMKDRLQYNR